MFIVGVIKKKIIIYIILVRLLVSLKKDKFSLLRYEIAKYLLYTVNIIKT